MAMSRKARQFYQFGPFRIDVAERLLQLEGENVTLTPKAFDLLLLLVENQGHLLEKDDLMKTLWPDTFVEEANLSNNVSQLRKVLSADSTHQYIETVPRRGYRFVAKVAMAPQAPEIISSEDVDYAVEEIGDKDSRGSISNSARRIKTPRLSLVVTAMLALGFAFYYFWPREFVTQKNAIRTIAVLPFKPLAADSSDESLQMGMADTLITRISNIRQ